MKLHLPLSLRSSLLAIFATAVTCQTAQAGIMHSDITLITYTDFGQNAGRYKTTESANALLQHIRTQEGGVAITYTGGQQTYIMPHGMIDFGSAYHVATCAAISPSAVATVAHNYTFDSWFSNKVYGIGNDNAVKYKGIELGEGTAGDSRWNSEVFSHSLSTSINNSTDHRVMRLSKVITDAPYAEIYDTTGKNLSNLTYYHAGSGQQWRSTYQTTTLIDRSYPNNATQLIGAYNYVIGGIVSGATQYAGSTGYYSQEYFNAGGINNSDPLTWVSRPGDSGSPLYVWDDVSKTYKYIGSNRGEILSGQVGSAFVTNTNFDKDVVENRYTQRVDMSSASTVYLNSVSTQGETKTDSRGYSTTLYSGTVTDAEGNALTSFYGLKSDLNTWGNLSGLKDTQNWYTYDESYVIQEMTDLFFTENLQFNATSAKNHIVLTDTVDLGIGFAEFSGGKFTITSESGESNLFNHAGYVINAGAEVHVQLTNPEVYMREWRKIGAGDLYIEGSGNNDALLNVGGSGTTYLNREGGYAAYNVLVNTGATVVIRDIGQIKRDLTFGNRGGTLDLNGNSMDWYTTAEAADSARDGFSINALTEDATIANHSGSATLTFRESGENTYVGSFADTTDSSLKIVYNADGTWILNSVRTNLQHTDSGLYVNNGTVILRGTNTVHGAGSESGRNENRYFNADDWHYADATMNVNVADGGTFELGSHARLSGNVTVHEGGTYVMREGVRHTMEYVEGGQILENTDKYSDFFGHKGNVQLRGGTFVVQLNDGVDSTTYYTGSVNGTGTMTVDAGTDGGFFSFCGSVDTGVSKSLNCGQLILTGIAASDTANKWLVNKDGVMVQFANAADTLSVIDSASTGIIGLRGNTNTQLNLSSHPGIGIGALFGTTVQYGVAGTSERLTTLNMGGSGKLVVNYVLSGSDELTVDGRGHRVGEIQLQQIADDFSGTINVQSNGGRMVLNTGDNCALSNAAVNVNDGGVLKSGNLSLNGGEAKIELHGSMEYEHLSISNGATLNLREGGRLDAEHAATIAQGGIMRLNAQTLQDNIELKNGGIMYGNGGTIGSTANVKATEDTGVLSAEGGTFNVNGQIGAAKDATLRLENGTYNIYTDSVNAAGGTLELACGTVNLGHKVNFATQNIGGTLSIANDVTINADQTSTNYQSPTHNINHLHIANGHKLTLNDPYSSWNHIYNISSLTGEGTIQWNSNIFWYYAGSSRMILSGDNSFSGTLIVNQQNNDGSMQHVSLAHENAAKNMVINLWGDSNSRPGLAISTKTARVAGIGGTTNTFVYAGGVKTAGNGNDPTSSALNTLIIHTAGENHTFNGTLLGDSNFGLNLVKEGAGTQAFSNGANVLHDISALQGHLQFTAAPTIHGDVSIAQGAQLTIGSGAFSLDAGHTLHVLAGTNEQSAVLNNALVLNGGELSFNAFNANGAASLSISGVSIGANFGDSLNLSFGNMYAIQDGVSYLLASGDWSALTDKLTASVHGYLAAQLTADSSGLRAAFSMKEGHTAWVGNNGVLTSDANVVFAGFNGANSVEISTPTKITKGYFDNADTFTISSATGEEMSFDSIEKSNIGNLVVNTNVRAESMQVTDNAVISGSGTLSVGTLSTEADLTTELTIEATDVQGGGNKWTMDGTGRSFTQQMSAAQANTFSALTVEGQATLKLDSDGESRVSSTIEGTGTLAVSTQGLILEGDVSINRMTVADNLTVTLYNAASNSGDRKNFGTVVLGNGAILQTNDRYAVNADTTFGTIKLNGSSAVIQDSHHSGGYTIHNLTGDAGATLTLAKNVTSDNVTVFTLGSTNDTTEEGSRFSGTILVKQQNATSDSNRDVALLLNHANIAQNATINLDSAAQETPKVGLGVNMGSATIGGLRSGSALGIRAVVFSGSQSSDSNWITPSTATVNTLTINTAAGSSHEFYGQVQNVNLIKAGAGTQKLLGTSANFNGSLTVNGGTLALGTNAESMLTQAASVVINEGGTLDITTVKTAASVEVSNITGTGTLGLNLNTSSYGQTLKISSDFTGTTHVKQGTFTINGSTFGNTLKLGGGVHFQLTGGSTVTLDKDLVLEGVSQIHQNSDAKLTINGTVTGSGTYERKGGGTLDFNNTVNLNAFNQEVGATTNFNGNTTLGGMLLSSGTVKVASDLTLDGDSRLEVRNGATLELANGASVTRTNNWACWMQGSMNVLENASAEFITKDDDIHLSYNNGSNKGVINLGAGSSLSMDVKGFYFYNGNAINLEKGAELKLIQSKATISNKGTEQATLIASNTGTTNAQQYSLGNSNFELTNAHISSDSSSETTLTNRLTNSSVENAGSGKLTVNNAANSITDVYASAGDMAIMQQAAGLNLEELVVASGKAVSAYTGTSEIAEAEANITVSGHAEFGKDAVLNANLTLASGSSLSVAEGGLAMGSTLTLQQGITLDDTTLNRVYSLNRGESVALFTGVDGLKLGEKSYTSISANDEILAAPYFSNLNSDQYRLTYTGTDNGTLAIISAAVPEPTGSMLGLMGLVALTFRRRRK